MRSLLLTSLLICSLVSGCGAGTKDDNQEGIRISYARLSELSNLAYSGINEPQVIVMNNQAQLDVTWASYTANMQPKPTKPIINFTEHTLIAFFAGAQPSPCHKLAIDSIRDTGFETRIYFHTIAPSPLADCMQVIVYPHEWIIIRKTTDSVIAIKQTPPQ